MEVSSVVILLFGVSSFTLAVGYLWGDRYTQRSFKEVRVLSIKRGKRETFIALTHKGGGQIRIVSLPATDLTHEDIRYIMGWPSSVGLPDIQSMLASGEKDQ